MYSFKYQDKTDDYNHKNKKICKGVDKVAVKKDITHQDYINVLDTDKPIKKDVYSIRSFNHQLFTYYQSKVALTSYYDKMYMIDKNNIPYGYENWFILYLFI